MQGFELKDDASGDKDRTKKGLMLRGFGFGLFFSFCPASNP